MLLAAVNAGFLFIYLILRQDHYYFLVTGLVLIPLQSMTNSPLVSMKDLVS